MLSRHGRTPTRALSALTALALAGGAVAGCGDDGNDAPADEPARLAIEVSGSGTKATFDMPGEVAGGPTRIELRNATGQAHGVQLLRVDEGHEAQEAVDAATGWVQGGRPLPAWVHPDGGLEVGPRGQGAVTQTLQPGGYVAIDTATEGKPPIVGTFEVTGDEQADTLRGPGATIEAREYAFRASGLKAGRTTILFANRGREPHFVEAVPIKPGKTLADVRRFAREETGEPPVDFEAGASTAVLDGGGAQIVELELRRGRYALLCFVPNRAGGPPHSQLGMISQATVR